MKSTIRLVASRIVARHSKALAPRPARVKESYFAWCERVPAGRPSAGACLPRGAARGWRMHPTKPLTSRSRGAVPVDRREGAVKNELMAALLERCEKYGVRYIAIFSVAWDSLYGGNSVAKRALDEADMIVSSEGD